MAARTAQRIAATRDPAGTASRERRNVRLKCIGDGGNFGRVGQVVEVFADPDAMKFQFCLMASIVSKSPTPLLTPPPPDHCHISA